MKPALQKIPQAFFAEQISVQEQQAVYPKEK